MSFNDNNNNFISFDLITVNNGQGGTYIVDSPIIANWNLEGNDFKIILTDVYNTDALYRIQYLEINKLFGIG